MIDPVAPTEGDNMNQQAEARAMELAAELDRLHNKIEAWVRHGEAVPADVTTYDRWIVNMELRDIVTDSRARCGVDTLLARAERAEADLAELRAGVEALIESAECNQRPVTWRLDPDGLRKLLL